MIEYYKIIYLSTLMYSTLKSCTNVSENSLIRDNQFKFLVDNDAYHFLILTKNNQLD